MWAGHRGGRSAKGSSVDVVGTWTDDEQANTSSGWWTVFVKPAELAVDNYAALLADSTVLQSLLNKLYIAVRSTALVIVISASAAYALSWIDFPGRDTFTLVVVGLLVMPVQVALLLVAKLFGSLGPFGTVTGVVLFHVEFCLPFAIVLLRNLIGAARMDGAKERMIFRRVVLPIGKPAIASLTIFQFLRVWNDLLLAPVFADPGSAPLTVALRSQSRQFGSNFDLLPSDALLSRVVHNGFTRVRASCIRVAVTWIVGPRIDTLLKRHW